MKPPNQQPALERERGEVLQQWEDWSETPMLVLSFAWLGLFIVELVWGLTPILEAIGTTIWIAFIIDFSIKFILAPRKLIYFKHHWLIALSLLIPALRIFRIMRILCFFLALYAVVVFGYLTATLATFFIDRDAESDDAELASAKSIKALQAEITGLRTDIQALVRREIDRGDR